MKINKKNVGAIIFAVVFLAVFVVWMLVGGIEPIPDTNGPDDISLATITDENIINRDMGSVHAVTIKKSGIEVGNVAINSMVKFSSKDFSGIYEICYNNYIGKSDVEVRLGHLTVDSGNFKMVALLNDEIVGVIEPSDEEIVFRMDDINGYFSLRIAGESAAYSFTMSQMDYDHFAHD